MSLVSSQAEALAYTKWLGIGATSNSGSFLPTVAARIVVKGVHRRTDHWHLVQVGSLCSLAGFHGAVEYGFNDDVKMEEEQKG